MVKDLRPTELSPESLKEVANTRMQLYQALREEIKEEIRLQDEEKKLQKMIDLINEQIVKFYS